ncbi:hypothetical protein AZI86_02085 [Bdellovibrio bacteriovorus]|uniref:Uncharacterized protein n=1 Tax=Bdellovibrio bacteriovorus TaxID=959 RepID=A0A150WNX6_BDEBC|nr:hypothetical protein [Bdellovibrio bacteriovorus]KYG65885.1 hypothetical protein AZI86_02085 [Bdellovibrio bacteriovorus]
MRKVLFLFILLTSLPALAFLKLERVDLTKKNIELEFFADGSNVVLRDEQGWVTLKLVTLLMFQDSIYASYKKPEKAAAYLKQTPPHLNTLAPVLKEILKKIKSQNINAEQIDRLESLEESGLLDLQKDRKRTTEILLHDKIAPLLATAPEIKILKMNINGKETQKPARSLNPDDFIAYQLTASTLEVPPAKIYKTSPEILWNKKRTLFVIPKGSSE